MKTKKKLVLEEDSETPVIVLLTNLDFNPENAIEESARQAVLFAKAIDYRMGCVRRASAAKAKLESTRVEKGLRIRTKKHLTGEKLTESNLKDLVEANSLIQKLERSYALAKECEEYSFLLLEAYRMRRDGLKNIAQLISSGLGMQNFMAENSEKIEKVRDELRRKYSK